MPAVCATTYVQPIFSYQWTITDLPVGDGQSFYSNTYSTYSTSLQFNTNCTGRYRLRIKNDISTFNPTANEYFRLDFYTYNQGIVTRFLNKGDVLDETYWFDIGANAYLTVVTNVGFWLDSTSITGNWQCVLQAPLPATPTPTITSSVTPSPTPSRSPTPTPTKSPTPTLSPTVTPTPTPSATPYANKIYGFGLNSSGQLGDNTTDNKQQVQQLLISSSVWNQINGRSRNNSASIKNDGTLWMWGANNNGKLGDNTQIHRSSPVQIANGGVWKKLAGGFHHTLAIKSDNTLWGWGLNSFGELANVAFTSRTSSPQMVSADTTWTEISAGNTFSAGIKNNGTMYLWGINTYGQLGINKSASVLYNTSIITRESTNGTNWSKINLSSSNFASAITKSGTLYTWGYNVYGQLGLGHVVDMSSPTQVGTGSSDTWATVSLGDSHFAAIKTNGTLWTWGRNSYGQLGQQDTIHRSSPTQVSNGTTWSKIACGDNFTAAIKKDGTLWSWGRNTNFSLGNVGTLNNLSSPTQVVTAGLAWNDLSAGSEHVVLLLGDFPATNTPSPTASASATPTPSPSRSPTPTPTLSASPTPTVTASPTSSPSPTSSVTPSPTPSRSPSPTPSRSPTPTPSRSPTPTPTTTASLTPTPSPTATGATPVPTGTEPTPTTTPSPSPTPSPTGTPTSSPTPSPTISLPPTPTATSTQAPTSTASTPTPTPSATTTPVPSGTDPSPTPTPTATETPTPSPTNPTPTPSTTPAPTSTLPYLNAMNGRIWLWGENSYGELGDGTTTFRSSPVQNICNSTDWNSAGLGGNHVVAIKDDSSMWAWGLNYDGQLGDNTTINRSSPVHVVGNSDTWVLTSAGSKYSAGIKADGSLWTWGRNSYGVLGTNDTVHRSSPTQTVSGGNTWIKLSAGYGHMAGIKNDGTLWLWGENYAGCLGDNSTTLRSSPQQTVAQGTDWIEVACGYYFTLALKKDYSFWSWGTNYFGQLGNSSNLSVSSPIQSVYSGTTFKKLAAGGEFAGGLGLYQTPTPSPSPSPSPSPTPSVTESPTPSPSPSPSPSPTPSVTESPTPSPSGSPTPTPSGSASPTPSPSGSSTPTPTPSGSASPTPSPTHSPSPTPSPSPSPSFTPSPSPSPSPSPTPTATPLAAYLYLWGDNAQGQLGANDVTDRSLPIEVTGNTKQWLKIKAGNNHFAAIKTDNTLWVWGDNSSGELGQDNLTHRSSPVIIQIAGMSWFEVACGKLFMGAIANVVPTPTPTATAPFNFMYLWGGNAYGQIGDQTNVAKSLPVALDSYSDWNMVDTGENHLIGMKSDNSVWTWGSNTAGQLGKNNQNSLSSPIQITLAGQQFVNVFAGGRVSAFLAQSVTTATPTLSPSPTPTPTPTASGLYLYAWGNNSIGELGNNSTTSASEPISVGSNSNWSALEAGISHLIASKSDASIWTWGSNTVGQLGQNNQNPSSSPAQLLMAGQNFIQIFAGGNNIGLLSNPVPTPTPT